MSSDGREWILGDDPSVTLKADAFELMRAIPGRRNADQVRAYDWSADPEPFMPSFFLFGPRSDPLVE